MKNKTLAVITICVSVFLTGCTEDAANSAINRDGLAKFEPPASKVIVFAGQDNASVGGNDRFDNGYVDNIGLPGGITHYVGMGVDRTNKFKKVFDDTRVDGLNTESQWGAGPMCMRYYLESPVLKDCILHLSISMTSNNEDKVANGTHDRLIDELIQFLKEFDDRPFLIRIGYEFDGSWNAYDADNFKGAFRRITDKLRAADLTNFATVMASSSCSTPYETWKFYYPGDEYVDWVGYSYWGANPADCSSLKFARDKGKPVFIAEVTPRGHFLDKEDGLQLWQDWYTVFLKHIDDNIDIIRAISYINANWDSQPMWKGQGWGDTRIQVDNYIKQQWLEKMQQPRFINAEDKPFQYIGFGSE